MLNGCGAHLLRCLQQGYARFLGFADEFTRASGLTYMSMLRSGSHGSHSALQLDFLTRLTPAS